MNQLEFVALISPFKDRIFRLAKRLLVSTEEAQDASQEVFLKLWNKKAEIVTWKNAEAMAMTITKNYCLDQLKAKRSKNISLVSSNYSDGNPLERKLEDSNSLSWVQRIIEQLPEQQKIIVQLREIEQMEFSEIAEIMKMNETAVRVALSRSRKFIKEKMEETHSYGTK
jgi:RNA polymerase sigma-70 factor (ECF subfamily)